VDDLSGWEGIIVRVIYLDGNRNGPDKNRHSCGKKLVDDLPKERGGLRKIVGDPLGGEETGTSNPTT
jgi:hypothetical protein